MAAQRGTDGAVEVHTSSLICIILLFYGTLVQSLSVNNSYTSEMMRGLRMLDQSGLPYQVSSVLTTYNCDPRTLTDLFRFLSTLVQDNPEMRIGYDRFLQKSENITDLLMRRF